MKTTGLNFIEAVQAAIETGCKIKRTEDTMATSVCKLSTLTVHVTAILADDWEIVPDPPKTMTFQEAVAALTEGKIVKRLHTNEMYKLKDNPMCTSTGKSLVVYIENCYLTNGFVWDNVQATDWVIVGEGQS